MLILTIMAWSGLPIVCGTTPSPLGTSPITFRFPRCELSTKAVIIDLCLPWSKTVIESREISWYAFGETLLLSSITWINAGNSSSTGSSGI